MDLEIKWEPGKKPDSEVVIAAIQAFIDNASYWHWLANHEVYQWAQDACSDFVEDMEAEEAICEPDPDGDEDHDWGEYFYEELLKEGPDAILYVRIGDYRIGINYTERDSARATALIIKHGTDETVGGCTLKLP